MAKRNGNPWTQIQLHPGPNPLDSRSRPADIAPGGFRYKLNFQTTPDGKLCRRPGCVAFAGADGNVLNFDLHHQGADRQPITFGYENTTTAGNRQLFCGTQDSLFLLDEATGTWQTLITGYGDVGSRWTAATLQDVVQFTNGVGEPLYFDVESPPAGDLPKVDFGTGDVTVTGFTSGMKTAKIVVHFKGFIIYMNLTGKDGSRHPGAVTWCDMNYPLYWITTPHVLDESGTGITPVGGNQTLDPTEEILNAIELLGAVYIFTRRGIWRMTIANTSDPASIFEFSRVYYEPQQQTGCLVYPFTLVSTGLQLYWLSKEAPYFYDPYELAPKREDWLYKATGSIYKLSQMTGSSLIDDTYCNAPSGIWLPTSREIIWSWPGGYSVGLPNWSMAVQLDQKTGDVIDFGYSMLVNFRRKPEDGRCNETQVTIGASTRDYALKQIGSAFHREIYDVGDDITVDLSELSAVLNVIGYNSLGRGLIPTGYTDREKIIRLTHLEVDVTPEANPAELVVRIGNSGSLQDANEGQSATGDRTQNSEATTCAVAWGSGLAKSLVCAESQTMAELKAARLKPSKGMEFPVYQSGKYLYFEVEVVPKISAGANTSGGDVCIEQISFEVQALPKP